MSQEIAASKDPKPTTQSCFNIKHKASEMIGKEILKKKRKVHFSNDVQYDAADKKVPAKKSKDAHCTSPQKTKVLHKRPSTPKKTKFIERFLIDDEDNSIQIKMYDLDKPFESPLIVNSFDTMNTKFGRDVIVSSPPFTKSKHHFCSPDVTPMYLFHSSTRDMSPYYKSSTSPIFHNTSRKLFH